MISIARLLARQRSSICPLSMAAMASFKLAVAFSNSMATSCAGEAVIKACV